MKIIGLLNAWACEDWIEYTILQALDLVDDLIISIGAFHKYFKNIEDKTWEKAKKYLNHKKVKVVRTICNPSNTPDQNKCATLNSMLKISENIQKGNIIWIFDADEFYSKEAINEIKNFIHNNDFDQIYVTDRMFCINFSYYILYKHERIFKIKNKSCYFTPIQNFNPKPKIKVTLLKNNPMFHYSMLLGEQMKGIQWMLEDIPEAVVWYKKIYNHYEPENEKFWMIKNQKLTGNYGFWRNPNEKLIENNNHGLFRYDGKHPNIIEKRPLKKINDFREYMKKKSNYKQYKQTLQQIIKEKKKFEFKILFLKFSKTKIWKNYLEKSKLELLKITIFHNLYQKFFKYRV